MSEEQKPAKSFLEDKLERLENVDKKYGVQGLKDAPLADVTALLASKRLKLRDSPKGFSATDQQRADHRLLEMEVRELSGYVDSQLALANLTSVHKAFFGGEGYRPKQDQSKAKERGNEGREGR